MIYLNIFLVAFLAFALSMICGGGAGLLLIPILGTVLPAAQVPAALTIGTAVSSVTKLYIFFQQINWRIVKYFLPAALPGAILGAWLLSYLAPMYIEFCMALFLVSNLPYLFRKKLVISNDKPQLSNNFIKFTGFLAGFISALTGAVGVLFNRVYLRCGLDKEEIVATRAANEIILHVVKLCLYALLGLFSLKAFYLGVVVAIAAVLATYLMKYVLPKISIAVFSKFGYGAMVLSGLLLLNSAAVKIQDIHNPNLDIVRVSKGYDATVSWSDLIYTIEFKYGEGFEFEKIIPFSDLDSSRQAHVNEQNLGAVKIVIEKVYSMKKTSYEAYYYDKNNLLVKKIKFN